MWEKERWGKRLLHSRVWGFPSQGEHPPLMIYSFIHFSVSLSEDLGQTQQHVCKRERKKERWRQMFSVQWSLTSASLAEQIRLVADAGYERDTVTWKQTGIQRDNRMVKKRTGVCSPMTDADTFVARWRKSISLLLDFGLRAGSSASVTDLTHRLELVKATGGGCETGECVSVGKRDREIETARVQITAKTISQLIHSSIGA